MIRLGQLAGVPWIFFTPVAPAFFYFKEGARRARRKDQSAGPRLFLFREKRKAQGLEQRAKILEPGTTANQSSIHQFRTLVPPKQI